jgi:CrcB protein
VQNLILVGVGGFIGSVARYLVSGYVQQLGNGNLFPFGTAAVNVIGCFVIGLLSQLAEARGVFSPEARALVFVGVLGGFTTFSTFSNETFNLFRSGESAAALFNLGLQIIGGLGAVWLGRTVAYLVWR